MLLDGVNLERVRRASVWTPPKWQEGRQAEQPTRAGVEVSPSTLGDLFTPQR